MQNLPEDRTSPFAYSCHSVTGRMMTAEKRLHPNPFRLAETTPLRHFFNHVELYPSTIITAEARSQGSFLSRASSSSRKATWPGPGPPLTDGINGGGPGKQGEHASTHHNVIE